MYGRSAIFCTMPLRSIFATLEVRMVKDFLGPARPGNVSGTATASSPDMDVDMDLQKSESRPMPSAPLKTKS